VKPLFIVILVLLLSSFTIPLVKTSNNVCKKDTLAFSVSKALQEVNSSLIEDSVELACLHHQIALEYFYRYDYLLSLKYNKEALKIRKQINDGFLWKTHHNIALIYNELDNFRKALKHIQKANNLQGSKSSKDSISILRFLSYEYASIGDIEQAIQYGNIATQIKASTTKVAEAYNSIGLILTETKDSTNLKLALKHFNKSLDSIKEGPNFNKRAIPYYINKGVAYYHLNEIEKALENYYIALDLTSEENTLYKSYVINNIGYALIAVRKFDLALEKINEALSLKQSYFKKNTHHFRYAINHVNIGDVYFEKNNYGKALRNYHIAITNLTNSFRSSNIFHNPVLSDSLYVYSYIDLVEVLDLKGKAAFALYKQNKDETYLQLAHQSYLTLLDFHNQLQQEISTENSRLFQAKNILPYIENALEVIYELQDKDESIAESAFRLMEKNKATVLLQSINESQALQFANIPDTLLDQEGDLKTAINFYKKQLNDARVYEETQNIDRFEKLLFEEENKYDQLINNLESNYPGYYQLKYQQNEIQLKQAQNYLDDATAMLEYFVGDSSIYILSIQKEKSKLYKTTKPKNWNELINNFRQSVTDVDLIQNQSQEAFDIFTGSASELYTILLKQALEDLDADISHLKIIPDTELNYIPFDVLLTEQHVKATINYATLPYLLKKQTLSYAYSVALLFESIQHKNQQSKIDSLKLYAGFAPIYTSENIASIKTANQQNNIVLRNGNVVDLPNARKSVQQIASFLTGQAFLAAEASKQQFMDKAHQFKIIHLATHGFLNDENPLYSNLVFTNTADSTDNSLYAADLYNIELNADLVVLSACNTGTGKLQKGEGVMSLSRAFTYAGSNSLVMSLWEVPDKSTATIVQNFFQQLKKGKTKDDALQAAKLEFMQKYPMRAHPLFWAGFVPSGNMKAIDFEKGSSNWWIWALIIVIVLIGSGFAVTRK